VGGSICPGGYADLAQEFTAMPILSIGWYLGVYLELSWSPYASVISYASVGGWEFFNI
jgi:hypothetical protein